MKQDPVYVTSDALDAVFREIRLQEEKLRFELTDIKHRLRDVQQRLNDVCGTQRFLENFKDGNLR